MELAFSARGRLIGVAVLMAFAAACGGGGGGDSGLPGAPAPPAQVGGWTSTFAAAAVVLGQTGFDQVDPEGTAASPIPSPHGSPAVSADGRLFVASALSQLLVFNQFDSMNGPVAAFTFDLESALGADTIGAVSVQGSGLVLAAGHRVHIFDSAPDSQTDRPNVSSPPGFGCNPSTLNQPLSVVLTPLGQLIVADTFNHRVVVWNAIPGSEELGAPDIVLGQRTRDKCAQR